ncbi:unnamed protein product [Adineta steineri]|uniref:Syndecan n=1 Tax=Adineta steineri TaxID=433720 RepID=A0A819GSM5_9BILA|nr:unnamed protein product [Adineta steineri]CAF3890719.1 unnamed protein product [Adineta steineri]
MFIQLLVTCICLVIVVQSTVTNSSKDQPLGALTLPKQASVYDDYDLNDQKTLGNNAEGSGGAASLDEYADDDEEEQLSKVTANRNSSTTIMTTTRTTTMAILTTTSTTTTLTTITTTSTTTYSTTTTTLINKWSKTTFNYDQPKKKNPSSTTSSSPSPPYNDIDASEFKDDHEEYADELEDDAYYNEPTLSNKVSSTLFTPPPYPMLTTRQSLTTNQTRPIWTIFSFLTRPPIAIGILAGLAVGILTSIILLICIIRRYHKREKSHSSYTTGLLYPNQYGYSKSPQEFYA